MRNDNFPCTQMTPHVVKKHHEADLKPRTLSFSGATDPGTSKKKQLPVGEKSWNQWEEDHGRVMSGDVPGRVVEPVKERIWS